MDVDASTAVAATLVEKQETNEAEGTSSGLLVATKRGGGGGGGGGTPVTPTFFREMLEDLDEPIPTVQQLESFGLFDQTKSDRLLAVYRETHPSPVSPIHFTPASPTVEAPTPSPPRRPSEPQHRHSLAVLPLPTNYDASSPSPLSPSASPRLNPFAFVRKATIRPRPSQRAKSASDVQAVPPPPTPALGDVQPFFSGSTGAEESASPRNSFSLSRTETVKENRAPRKLRKATAPKISVRTDDDYLLRPFTVPAPAPATTSPSPSPEPARERENASSPSVPSSATGSRPPPIRLPSWRSSASSIAVSPSSYAFSPTSSEHALPPLRPPSPVGSFPASIRREGALPPVEAKKRGSTTTSGSSSTDDYLADNERVARFSPRASRTRFGSTAPAGGSAPASPTSAGGVWGKLRLGGGKKSSGGSRPSSIASVDSTSTWEVVDGAEAGAAAGGPAAPRSFEVLGRPASRPPTERSISYDSETAPGPLDSPNLSRILEQSELGGSLWKRSSSGASRPSTSTSIDSLAFASGATTPNGGQQGVSAASSMTAGGGGGGGGGGRPGMPRSRPSSNLNLATASSFSSLRSHPPSPLAPLSPSATAASPGAGKVTSNPFFVAHDPSAASTTSLVSGSWPSSRSSTRSRDSLFFSADGEGEGSGGSGEGEDGYGDGETPASSALEEEEEEEAVPRAARTKGKGKEQQELPLLERLVIEEAALAGRAV